jgi:hypothetical protein
MKIRRSSQPHVNVINRQTAGRAELRSRLLCVAVAACMLAAGVAHAGATAQGKSRAPIGSPKRMVSPYARAAAAHAVTAPTPGHPGVLHSPSEVQGLGMRAHKQTRGKPH